MNRLLLLWLLLALALCGSTAKAETSSGVTLDSIWTEGRLMALYDFEVHLIVTNHDDKDIEESDGFFQLVCSDMSKEEEYFKPVGATWASFGAGETKELVILTSVYNPGTYQIFATQSEDDITPSTREKFFPLSVTIEVAEYRKPALRVEYDVNMTTSSDGTNAVYGNRVSGRLLLINDDDQPFTGYFNFIGLNGFNLFLVTNLDSTYVTRVAQAKVTEEIAAADTIAYDFCFDVDMKYGQRYNLGVLWSTVGGHISQVGVYDFESRSGLATYWTPQKEVKPLPRNGSDLLLPADAVAVDLRGLYKVNTFFSMIDTNGANPNCLYYLDFMDNLPAGVPMTANVVRDYEAKSLTISRDYDYYCPMPFEVKLAEFCCRPKQAEMGDGRSDKGREVIVRPVAFPFEVQRAGYPDINGTAGVDVSSDSSDMGFYRYVGDSDGVLYFQPLAANSLNAYEPYMMWTLPYPVVFHAENTLVPATKQAVAHGTNFDFIGFATEQMLTSQHYCWHYNDNSFARSAATEKEEPFTPLMLYVGSDDCEKVASSGTLPIRGIREIESDGEPEEAVTALTSPDNENSRVATPVYTLSGQRIGDVSKTSLKPGLYIIGGRKTIIK